MSVTSRASPTTLAALPSAALASALLAHVEPAPAAVAVLPAQELLLGWSDSVGRMLTTRSCSSTSSGCRRARPRLAKASGG